MARSNFSPSPSPGFASSRFSDSSLDDDNEVPIEATHAVSTTVSHPDSLVNSDPNIPQVPPVDTAQCQWEDCAKAFDRLSALIEHLHHDHIGVHKSNYTCEWNTCPRRGIAQTSRFALISHIRSHTGEKPFVCSKPECDKSFTRSDALAKHMRMQHNIMPPMPGRGGNRRKKKGEADTAHQATDGYATFKVDQHFSYDPHGHREFDDEHTPLAGPSMHTDHFSNGLGLADHRSLSPDVVMPESDGEDDIPPHLTELQDPETGLIMGRSPAMVKYILWKAKHRYVLEEHSSLIEELRTLRYEEKCWRERKDALLDEILRVTFGPQAEQLVIPPTMFAQEALRPVRKHSDDDERVEEEL